MKKFLYAVLALVLMTSCYGIEDTLCEQSNDDELYLSIESLNVTKTSMDENNNVLWSEGDRIIAFMNTTLGIKYQVKEAYVGSTTGGFSKVDETVNDDDLESGQEIDHKVVFYPYSADVWCMKNDNNNPAHSYKLNVILPETQEYAENSFANNSFPMVAVSSSNQLTFRNVCGGIKLNLLGVDKIKTIKLEGLGGEALAGKSTVVGYVNGNAPAITMSTTDVSKSVTLDCGDGVQLNEKSPTSFIISLPPITFESGMKIIVTDTDGKSRTLTNTSKNPIVRSCLLTFPDITYKQEDAVLPTGTAYIDEDGNNHGLGIEINGVVWAPVNCGYHETDYPYGKLYQWGRKYGQGYSGELWGKNDNNEWDRTEVDASDETYVTESVVVEGPVSVEVGNNPNNENIFYTIEQIWDESNNKWLNTDWVTPSNDRLWNSGTKLVPEKTEYDPCPTGWRVPSQKELSELYVNHSSFTKNDKGQSGYWFSGDSPYSENVPQIFLSAAGSLDWKSGWSYYRGWNGSYWSSGTEPEHGQLLSFDDTYPAMRVSARGDAHSVRCVKE